MAPPIEEAVRRLVHEHLGVPEHVIGPQSSFVDDLGADSLARIDLTLALEEAFQIDIEDEAFRKLRTVRDAVVYVEERVADRNSVV